MRGTSVALRRHERYLQLAEDLNSLRWSWNDSLHISQIVSARLHDAAPLKFTITHATLAAHSDELTLSLETQRAEHAKKWVTALSLLQRASRERDAAVPASTLVVLRTAFRTAARIGSFRAAARNAEVLEAAPQQLAFFGCLNRVLTEAELKKYHAEAVKETEEKDTLGSWPAMLRVYLRAVRCAELAGLFGQYANWGQGGGALSLEDFKNFWREQQCGHGPVATQKEAKEIEVAKEAKEATETKVAKGKKKSAARRGKGGPIDPSTGRPLEKNAKGSYKIGHLAGADGRVNLWDIPGFKNDDVFDTAINMRMPCWLASTGWTLADPLPWPPPPPPPPRGSIVSVAGASVFRLLPVLL